MSKNRLLSRPETATGQRFQSTNEDTISIPTLDGGMNTKSDPADLDNSEFTVAQNVFIRNQKVTRRFGISLLSPAKPDSNTIKRLYTAKQYDGTVVQLRFAQNSIYRRTEGAWIEIVPSASSILAPANNIISTDDRHFFSNNGANVIQEVVLGSDSYSSLGNAPRYKYITSFYNRIIGANLVGGAPIPIQVGWSGDFNFGEWDTNVDPSAGFAPLEESQSDYADAITGLFGFANQMIILREQSIWLANKIPGTNPFFFFTAVPSVGCDVPNSVQKIPGGIVFYDRRTNSLYSFTIKEGIKDIGVPIEDSIYASISDPDKVFSVFDPIELEYKLCCPLQGTNTVRCWTYSFKNDKMWYDDFDNITSADTVLFEEPTVFIQDLSGNIENLLGNIEDLGPPLVPTASLWFGRTDGDINIQDEATVTGFTSIITSKTWTAGKDVDFYIQRLSFTYQVLASGSFEIQYSKDNQLTWITHKTVTISSANIGKRLKVTCAKSIKSRQFNWRVVSSSGSFSLIDFKAIIESAGYST